MNKKKQIDAEKMLSKLLMEAMREEIDNDLMNALKDPNYVIQSTPITFESEEDKQKYEEHFKKVWDERNDFLKHKEDNKELRRLNNLVKQIEDENLDPCLKMKLRDGIMSAYWKLIRVFKIELNPCMECNLFNSVEDGLCDICWGKKNKI